MVQVSVDRPNVNWKMLNKITEERCSVEHYPGLIKVGSCSLHVMHDAFRSGVIKRLKPSGELTQCWRPCTTCLMSLQPEEKITSRWLEVRCLHCHSVATDGLKIRKLLKGPYRSGPTSSPTSVRLWRSQRVKFLPQVHSSHWDQLYRTN